MVDGNDASVANVHVSDPLTGKSEEPREKTGGIPDQYQYNEFAGRLLGPHHIRHAELETGTPWCMLSFSSDLTVL